MDELSEKHQKFVDHYLVTQNATESAKVAGYSGDSAHNQGSRLLQREDVSQAIDVAQKEVQSEPGRSLGDALSRIEKYIKLAKESGNKALELKGIEHHDKLSGHLWSQHRVELGGGFSVSLAGVCPPAYAADELARYKIGEIHELCREKGVPSIEGLLLLLKAMPDQPAEVLEQAEAEFLALGTQKNINEIINGPPDSSPGRLETPDDGGDDE